MSESVKRWQDGLRRRNGASETEINRREAALDAFCERHGVEPDELLARWEDFGELTVRRRPRATETPDTAVESFLIHNGINVFGDIVCVAGRPEDLATQGPQFVPRPG